MIFHRSRRAKIPNWRPPTAPILRSRLHPRRWTPTTTTAATATRKTSGCWPAAEAGSVWHKNCTTNFSSVRSASRTSATRSASSACTRSASNVSRTTCSPKPATRNIPIIVSISVHAHFPSHLSDKIISVMTEH